VKKTKINENMKRKEKALSYLVGESPKIQFQKCLHKKSFAKFSETRKAQILSEVPGCAPNRASCAALLYTELFESQRILQSSSYASI
jgi:hypothetical protein